VLLRLLRQTQLGDLLSLVSPSLFDVISVPTVLRRARHIVAESKRTWPDLREELQRNLSGTVSLESSAGHGLGDLPDGAPRSVGQRILGVYFRQLHSPGPTALDLRSPSWCLNGDVLHWNPTPLAVRWDPAFIDAMRAVYRGHYADDDATFLEGLGRLGLAEAAPLFRAHFGDGDATAHVFDRAHFVASFGAIFDHCKQTGVRLHSDFVPLGAYLAGLYDSLSDLGVPLDVAGAFHEAATPPKEGS